MTAESLYCLFRCKSRRYAVAVDRVACVMESPRLVGLPLCPSRMVGLCSYRREVVPVLDLGSEPASGSSHAVSASAEESVLLIHSTSGTWGIRVDRSRTRIAGARLSCHETAGGDGGVVTTGLVRHEGSEHALIDVDSTWESIRSEVLRRYAAASAPAPQS
jgi:chemotaxis signal transduction protein